MTDELDFTFAMPAAASTAAPAPLYSAAAARKFFALQGEEAEARAGEVIFAENEKGNRLFLQRDKMYLLLEGEVELSMQKRVIGTVKAGEIFGEFASITQTARSATARAKTACRLIALDDKQLLSSLHEQPEFALALIGVIADRLRDMLERMNAKGIQPGEEGGREGYAFDNALLDELQDEAGEKARMRYPARKAIMEQGQSGVYMYVVLEGEVEIYIGDHLVEALGPGGMFGELALIGRTQRLASAVAESDCELLAINRNLFIELVKTKPQFGVAVLAAIGARARYLAAQRG